MHLTVGTTTVGRWKRLEQCVDSILSGTKQPDEFLVLDNSPDGKADEILREYEVEVLHESERISPSEARNRLAAEVDEGALLYVDDDVKADSKAVENMYHRLIKTEYRAVSAVWTDHNKYYRRVGNTLHFDNVGGNLLIHPINYRDVSNFETLEIMFSTPQLMIEKELLEQCSFDPDYSFYYEWMDFFMQMYDRDEFVLAVLDAEFNHNPGGYKGTESTRHGDYERADDSVYFEEKWGYAPKEQIYVDEYYNTSSISRFLSTILRTANKKQKQLF